MMLNKKGAALMQVLLVTAILAGMATMLLRAKLGRTSTSRKMRRSMAAQMLIKSCQAEVNTIWSVKSPEEFAWAMQNCAMKCQVTPSSSGGEFTCPSERTVRLHRCQKQEINDELYQVVATFPESSPQMHGLCELKYDTYKCGDSSCTPSNYKFPEEL